MSNKRHAAAGGLHLNLDLLVVEFAGAEFFSERFLGRGAGIGAHERIEHAVFGSLLGFRLDVLAFPFAHLRNGNLDQVSHDLLDVASDIADLGEFRCFHLEERCARKLGETAGDFGLADAGRADHQNVLR